MKRIFTLLVGILIGLSLNVAGTASKPDSVAILAAPVRDTRVTLTWTAATDDRGVSGYRVSRDGVPVAAARVDPAEIERLFRTRQPV